MEWGAAVSTALGAIIAVVVAMISIHYQRRIDSREGRIDAQMRDRRVMIDELRRESGRMIKAASQISVTKPRANSHLFNSPVSAQLLMDAQAEMDDAQLMMTLAYQAIGDSHVEALSQELTDLSSGLNADRATQAELQVVAQQMAEKCRELWEMLGEMRNATFRS